MKEVKFVCSCAGCQGAPKFKLTLLVGAKVGHVTYMCEKHSFPWMEKGESRFYAVAALPKLQNNYSRYCQSGNNKVPLGMPKKVQYDPAKGEGQALLADLTAKLGTQSQIAEYFGVRQGTVCKWSKWEKIPPAFYRNHGEKMVVLGIIFPFELDIKLNAKKYATQKSQ